ncbi:MAG: CHAT domain-containing protein [Chitinophaga sp.]|uniref:CHAT domain-containing protein n=1 Tax=Chitinophaga sp. TaxID=1869181 RepID=UPI0025BEBA49|nr:CHAT domain-containing protein [Chitinophaga sp.]MBV8252870.1 CHAT domain-containing protein [Chitinophaga sp.]
MDSIIAVEQNSNPNAEKLTQLQKLLQVQRSCFHEKDSIYARLMHRMGNIYHLMRSWDNAIAYTKEAIAVNRTAKARQESFLVNSYFNLGLFYNKLQLYTESYHYFDSCILLGIKFPEKTNIALMAFETKAFALYGNADYQQAREVAELGVRVAHSAGDTLSEVALLAQKAQSMLALEDTAAGTVIRRAVALLPASAPMEHRISCYAIYASVLAKEKHTAEAIKWYRAAILQNSRLQRWDQCARNTLDLGNCYAEVMKNPQQAMRCYREGIAFARKSGDAYVLAGVYNNIGSAYWHLKDYKHALENYQAGLNTLPLQFTDTSFARNPDYETLHRVSNDYFVYTLLSNKGESLLDLYKTSNNKNVLLAALHTYLAADQVVDLMRRKQYGESTQLYWRDRTRKMYAQAIEVCYLMQDAFTACHFFEKSRAVLLNDKLNELGAKQYLPSADADQEQQLRIHETALRQQLESMTPDSSAYRQVAHQLFDARSALERYISNLEATHPGYFSYKYDTTGIRPGDIRKYLLQAGESMVSYFLTDSNAYVLTVTPTREQLHRFSCNRDELKSLQQLLTQRTMTAADYRQYTILSWKMYQQLVAPLQLKQGSVIVSPDEFFLPLEALHTDTSQRNSLLVQQYAFSYVYSARSLIKRARIHNGAAYDFLGVAPVNYATEMQVQPLLGADRSVDNIRADYQGVRILLGTNATRKNFLEQLPRSSVVQLYTHASAGTAQGEPVLYLADATIRLPEIKLLEDTVTSLIILSSCESGSGRLAQGEGVLSLARGFTLTGIPSVITALWQIDNTATYELTESLHAALAKGIRKDIALQQAKIKYLSNNDIDRQLPYYWAATVLMGDTSPVRVAESSKFSWWWVLIGAVLLMAIIFLVKKIL